MGTEPTETLVSLEDANSSVDLNELLEALGCPQISPEESIARSKVTPCPLDGRHNADKFPVTRTLHCFPCDKHWNVVDLVMEARGYSNPYDAGIWLGQRFAVARIPKLYGKHNQCVVSFSLSSKAKIKRLEPNRRTFDMAPGFHRLTNTAKMLAHWLLRQPQGPIEITQKKLARSFGLRDRHAIGNALKALNQIGLIAKDVAVPPKAKDPSGQFTTTTIVSLNWRSDRFQRWLIGEEIMEGRAEAGYDTASNCIDGRKSTPVSTPANLTKSTTVDGWVYPSNEPAYPEHPVEVSLENWTRFMDKFRWRLEADRSNRGLPQARYGMDDFQITRRWIRGSSMLPEVKRELLGTITPECPAVQPQLSGF